MSLNPEARRDWRYAALLIVWEIGVACGAMIYLEQSASNSDLNVWIARLMGCLVVFLAGSVTIMVAWYGRAKVLALRPLFVWYGLNMLGALPAGLAAAGSLALVS